MKKNKPGPAGRIKQPEKPKEGSPVWLTIYSDLMTNLMLFFLMLYGITRMSVETKSTILESLAMQFKNPEKQKAIMKSYEKTAADIEKFMVNVRENPVVEEVLAEQSGYKILLKAPVLFHSARAQIRDESKIQLLTLAQFLAAIPNTVEIIGHTDDIPVTGTKWKNNWELSLARAESVRNFLVSQGIKKEKFCIAGYGSKRPICPNDSQENRRRNRRIEIIVLK
ncbi:MAG: OmpA family protein [bacterium]